MIFDPCKQVRLDAANLPAHLADLTSDRGGLGIVVCVGEVIAQITDLIEAALYCGDDTERKCLIFGSSGWVRSRQRWQSGGRRVRQGPLGSFGIQFLKMGMKRG